MKKSNIFEKPKEELLLKYINKYEKGLSNFYFATIEPPYFYYVIK